jgi:hypothetical protein
MVNTSFIYTSYDLPLSLGAFNGVSHLVILDVLNSFDKSVNILDFPIVLGFSELNLREIWLQGMGLCQKTHEKPIHSTEDE